MKYRRAFIPGGTWFFTVVTNQRQAFLAEPENISVLREAFKQVKEKYPFTIDAIVIMPDHLHCIWTLPKSDSDFATRWRLIKTWFTKHCQQDFRPIWQRRYWEHLLRDEADYNKHIDYIHYNPVKHRYVNSVAEWQYSSFHKYLKQGFYPENWGCIELDFTGIGNE